MQTAADFAAALSALRRRAGLTVREVSRRTGIPAGTLGGYFSGRHLPAMTQPRVLADLLAALGVGDDELPTWREQLAGVRRRPGPRPRVKPGLDDQDGGQATDLDAVAVSAGEGDAQPKWQT
jgi:transcriptional regulator with XRE-family HTH domain